MNGALVILRFEKERFFVMNCPFNNHDLVSFNGCIYSVSNVVWSLII